MAVVQVSFGRTAMEIARANIHDAIATLSRNILAGQYTEAEYKFNAGIAYGLQQALNTLDLSEQEAQKEM